MYTFAFILCTMMAVGGAMAIACELLMNRYFEFQEEDEEYGVE